MIQPVILWTDALVFLLVVVVLVFALYARNKEHLRAPWRQVVRSRMAVASLVVLSAYTVTGLLDSIHFRTALPETAGQREIQYSGEVLSVLDTLLGPVRTQVEKSYSAPFATHLYTRESVTTGEGETVRIFPRLQFGGAHLADPAHKGADIAARSAIAAAQAVAATAALYLLAGCWVSWRAAKPKYPGARRCSRCC